ncbi:MAG: hypothetical protein LBB11_04135 [Puniceicoccales bacterium]|jgi:hypothetical protein|nr:hypothetical protein [Puniceicoccales bacterium]
MENTAKKLIEYVLTKLEKESVQERIELYNILADFLPHEEASARLRQYAEELQQIDLKCRHIKSFFLTNQHENYEH